MDWERIHKEAFVFDLHAHPSLKVSLFGRILTLNNKAGKQFDPFSARTDFPKLRAGGVNGLLSVVYAPEEGLLRDCTPLRWVKAFYPTRDPIFTGKDFDVAVGMLERIEEVVADALDPETGESLGMVAHSVGELDAVVNQPDDERIVLVHSIEGAHTLDGNLSNLDRFFELGVSYMTLAHFYENGVAPPVFPFPEDMQALGCFRERRDLTLGLTGLGEQVVERMKELGMLIDVTHCTPVARQHVYNIVQEKAPLLATHVGTYEINPNPYNISDDEARLIADSGGLIGVIFMNYWLAPYTRKRGIDFVVQTIQHFVDVAGIDHVGIGSDFDGFTDPPDDLKDASYLPFLTQRLVAEGFTDVDIHKLLGGNALRVLRDGWGKRT